MLWVVDLRKYFTPRTIALALKQLEKIESPVMDLIYKAKRQHPFPVIGIQEISEIIRNVPVVRRGSRAIALTGRKFKADFIEPQGPRVFDFVDAVELNNLKLLIDQGLAENLQQWINSKVNKVRKVVRLTSEALCAISLKGNIKYAMQTDDGMDTYEVNFGTTLSFTPEMAWDTAVTGTQVFHKLMTRIAGDLRNIKKHIRKNAFGYGTRIIFLAGENVISTLAGLIPQYINDSRIEAKVEDEVITIMKHKIRSFDYEYFDPLTETFFPVVDPDSLVGIALDAPFTFFYIAIDDLKAGLRPMPLFIFPQQIDDPSGYKLLGTSKPLPVPVPRAICWAKVVNL